MSQNTRYKFVDELIYLLNDENTRTHPALHISDLEDYGRQLSKELFYRINSKIKLKLQRLPSKNLVLELDDQLAYIPLELIHDGELFLCEKFNIGRQITTEDPEESILPVRPLEYPLKMLIIADPTGDLEYAKKEGIQIWELVDNLY